MEASQQSLLQQRLNPLTGQSEWVLVADDESNDSDKRHQLAYSSYLDMLNDTDRNRAYDRAIRKAVSGPVHVLDIGAGTGLLSMMAARALEESVVPLNYNGEGRTVVACEAFLPMFRLARKVLNSNGLSSKVHLLHKRSEDIKVGVDMPSLADVLVTEILDSELLGEGLIPTLQHAHDFLLAPNARVVPYKATIYGQLVECDHLWRLHDLHGVEGLVRDGLVLASLNSKRAICLRPSQYAMHIDALMHKLQRVSDPFEVFVFNFGKRLDEFGETEVYAKAIETGAAHAIVSWWVLQLDEGGSVFYSTAPRWIHQTCSTGQTDICASMLPNGIEGCSWHDHWKQCVWFLPGQGLHLVADERIIVRATHDAVSFRYDIGSEKILGVSTAGELNKIGKSGLFMNPERIGLLGSEKWRAIIIAAIRKTLYARSSSLCLVLDDSLPLTVATAASSRSSLVVAMLPGLRLDGLEFLQTVSEANGFCTGQVKVLGKNAPELTFEDIGGRKVDVLLAEPYYWAYESMLPWQNLRFWNDRTCLMKFLSEKVATIPCKGILRGTAMSLPDLWHSRQSLTSVEGFDHSLVNVALGACGNLPASLEGPILPCAIWQCGENEELTEQFSIMTFDFLRPIDTVRSSIKVHISKSGLCHGIALWIDWVMEAESNLVISTGPEGHEPTYWKQGVKLLTSPVRVERYKVEDEVQSSKDPKDEQFCTFVLSVTFDSDNSDLTVEANFMNS